MAGVPGSRRGALGGAACVASASSCAAPGNAGGGNTHLGVVRAMGCCGAMPLMPAACVLPALISIATAAAGGSTKAGGGSRSNRMGQQQQRQCRQLAQASHSVLWQLTAACAACCCFWSPLPLKPPHVSARVHARLLAAVSSGTSRPPAQPLPLPPLLSLPPLQGQHGSTNGAPITLPCTLLACVHSINHYPPCCSAPP